MNTETIDKYTAKDAMMQSLMPVLNTEFSVLPAVILLIKQAAIKRRNTLKFYGSMILSDVTQLKQLGYTIEIVNRDNMPFLTELYLIRW